MDARKAIVDRHSTRYYLDKPVDLTSFDEIVKEAQHAPSWENAQSGKIYLISGGPLEKLRKVYGERNSQKIHGNGDLEMAHHDQWAPQEKGNIEQWTTGVKQLLGGGDDWFDTIRKAENKLYNTQAVVYLTLPHGYNPWALYDLGALSESLLTAITARGIDSNVAYQYIKYPDLVRQFVPLKDDEDLIIGIGLGYEDHDHILNKIETNRQPLAKIFQRIQ